MCSRVTESQEDQFQLGREILDTVDYALVDNIGYKMNLYTTEIGN